MQIRITWTNLKQSDALEEYFVHKVEHLEHFYKPILTAALELAHDRHHKKGNVYRAEARLAVPKKTLYASELASTGFEAVDLLVEQLEKEIKRYKDRYNNKSKRRSLKEKQQIGRRFARAALKPPR